MNYYYRVNGINANGGVVATLAKPPQMDSKGELYHAPLLEVISDLWHANVPHGEITDVDSCKIELMNDHLVRTSYRQLTDRGLVRILAELLEWVDPVTNLPIEVIAGDVYAGHGKDAVDFSPWDRHEFAFYLSRKYAVDLIFDQAGCALVGNAKSIGADRVFSNRVSDLVRYITSTAVGKLLEARSSLSRDPKHIVTVPKSMVKID